MKKKYTLKGIALVASVCLVACAVLALGAQQVQASGSLTTMDGTEDEIEDVHETGDVCTDCHTDEAWRFLLTRIKPPKAAKFVYDGTEKAVTRPCGEVEIEGTTEAVDAGSYSCTATLDKMSCWFDGSIEPYTLEWSIEPAQMGSASIRLSSTSLAYTGKPVAPKVSATYAGMSLAEGVDYAVSYKNNARAGRATVTLTGKGNYAGTATRSFTIGKVKRTGGKRVKVAKGSACLLGTNAASLTGACVAKVTSSNPKVVSAKGWSLTKKGIRLKKAKRAGACTVTAAFDNGQKISWKITVTKK